MFLFFIFNQYWLSEVQLISDPQFTVNHCAHKMVRDDYYCDLRTKLNIYIESLYLPAYSGKHLIIILCTCIEP